MKYHIITFGCQMNKSDSERIAATLENKGYKSALSINEADLILVNMCSVRQSAVDRVFGLSKKFLNLKAQNSKLKIVLTGCVLKSDRNKLKEKFDYVWDNNDFSEITPKYHKGNPAFIPISDGCDNFCTYCAVPYTRGPLVCRDRKKILKDAKEVIKNGAKEIWLLGQNVNNYKSQGINFAKLLKMVNALSGDFKIRFMSPHPAYFTDELIETLANCRKVAHYLNLPVQSGDNGILKKMARPYNVEQYKNLVKKIRKKIPDINLSTDVIVGFPGETKKQFENTVKLFKELKFNMAYISKYSPRPGTTAFKLKNNVPIKEKKRRWKILNSLLS